jgi:hypothetical protein
MISKSLASIQKRIERIKAQLTAIDPGRMTSR